MTEYCKQCGSVQMRWPDIAAAMEDTIEAAPNGVKAMFRQAIDEIRELRKAARPYTGPEPYAQYPMTYTFRDENCDDLYRDAMRYRKLREHNLRCDGLGVANERGQLLDRILDAWSGK